MKQLVNYYIAILVLITLSISSCDKWLDQAPTGEVTQEFIFEDWRRAQRYIDVLYANRIRDWADGNRLSGTGRGGLLESATDMAEYTANYGVANKSFNIGNWYESEMTPLEVDRWGNSYQNIRRCYMFLENIDGFTNDSPDYLGDGVRRKVLMKGEVHFMIAWYYNELLKRYGGVPIITSTLNFDTDFRIPRSTYDQTKDFILAHLDSAQTILPHTWPSDHGRITKTVVMAFRSRLLLYAASELNNPTNESSRWLAAANAARDLIDYVEDPASPGYNLHSLEPHWQRIFMRGEFPEQVKEIIDPRKRSAYTYDFNSVLIRNNCATPGEPFQGFGSNGPTQNFVDRFEVLIKDAGGVVVGSEKFDWNNPEHVGVNGNNLYKNRDPRFYYTVVYNDQVWIHRKMEIWRDGPNYGRDLNPKDHLYTHTGYYLKKFWPRECRQALAPVGSSTLTGFYSRLGEIYLNYAEALNEVSGPDLDNLGRATTLTARDAVNKIRARVVCPSFATAPATNHPFYQVWLERQDSPNFPVLPTGIPPIPLTEDVTTGTFRERVRNERVIELSFEDHYWYDILRWKLGEVHIGGAIYGIDIVKAGSDFIHRRVKVEDRVFDPARMYHYPIPQREINVMQIEQNPGW